MFVEQARAFDGLETPAWIPPREGETLQDHTRRFAAHVGPDARPTWVGGTSFGGQVALEMVRWMRPGPVWR